MANAVLGTGHNTALWNPYQTKLSPGINSYEMNNLITKLYNLACPKHPHEILKVRLLLLEAYSGKILI